MDFNAEARYIAIAFVEWLWKNVDEVEISKHDWDYFYDMWLNTIKE